MQSKNGLSLLGLLLGVRHTKGRLSRWHHPPLRRPPARGHFPRWWCIICLPPFNAHRGGAMFPRIIRYVFLCGVGCATLFQPLPALSQAIPTAPVQMPGVNTRDLLTVGNGTPMSRPSLDVYLRDVSGASIGQVALVTLSASTGDLLRQSSAKSGHIEFKDLKPGMYTIQVLAPGYDAFQQTVQMNLAPMSVTISVRSGSAFAPAGTPALSKLLALPQKDQKLVAKIQETLGGSKPHDARKPLEKLYGSAPGNPDVNYMYGLFESKIGDMGKAQSYWKMAVEVYPQHFAALTQLVEAALRDHKPEQAVPYLRRAIEADPTAWRSHALLAQALLDEGESIQAVQEANRAIELGHNQADSVQPLLARALAAQGNTTQAIDTLATYLRAQPSDAKAKELLNSLRAAGSSSSGAALANAASAAPFEPPPILSTAWRPPDVDESIPSVEAGTACPQESVLTKAQARLAELVANVDRFSAVEWVKSERIGRDGLSAMTDMRLFNYIVSISSPRPGLMSVDEYRTAREGPEDFPDDIATFGLPALVLAFHSSQAPNFVYSCEGLAHLTTGPAWQIRFQQKPDRLPTLRAYQSGDQFTRVALKGRAWISAYTFQVVRLETDLSRPYPQIRLISEHTVIEYGAVHFQSKVVDMWLPKTAEVYFDWKGRRIHRSHSYSNYMLFSVDSQHKISAPKGAPPAGPPPDSPPAPVKP